MKERIIEFLRMHPMGATRSQIWSKTGKVNSFDLVSAMEELIAERKIKRLISIDVSIPDKYTLTDNGSTK